MTLWDLKPNNKAIILGYDKELETSVCQRLIDLGFVIGSKVECVRKTPFSGPQVFFINETLFAFEKQIANCVFIDAEVGSL